MVDAPEQQDRAALAAELALGLLDGPERATALRLRLSDPAFARETEDWSARLSPLFDEVPPAQPSPRVWDSVSARIGHAPETADGPKLRAWRAGALVSGAVAAALALFMLIRPVEPPVRAPMAVSQIAGADGGALMVVSYEPGKGVLRVSQQARVGNGKSPELWVIPQDGIPRSLGLLARDGGRMSVDPAMRPLLVADATLAVTMEDPATAPHAAPTALPVMTGKISMI